MWYSPVRQPAWHRKPSVVVRIIEQNGRRFTVQEVAPERGVLLSLDSVNPLDYLNPAWQRGQPFTWSGRPRRLHLTVTD